MACRAARRRGPRAWTRSPAALRDASIPDGYRRSIDLRFPHPSPHPMSEVPRSGQSTPVRRDSGRVTAHIRGNKFISRFDYVPRSLARPLLLLLLLGAGVPGPGDTFAQSMAGTGFWARAGAAQYNLVGTGVLRQATIRADLNVRTRLAGEGSLSYRRPAVHIDEGTASLVPRVSIRLRGPHGPVVPYVEAGGSVALTLPTGRKAASRATLTSIAGHRRPGRLPGSASRVGFPGRKLGIEGDLRVLSNGLSVRPSTAELRTMFVWRLSAGRAHGRKPLDRGVETTSRAGPGQPQHPHVRDEVDCERNRRPDRDDWTSPRVRSASPCPTGSKLCSSRILLERTERIECDRHPLPNVDIPWMADPEWAPVRPLHYGRFFRIDRHQRR
jgi:hypothetical protein